MKITVEQLSQFFVENFAGDAELMPNFIDLSDGLVVMEQIAHPALIRPGGYISGPTQMHMADTAAYAVIFTKLGITPMAVTTHVSIDFLRPCIGDAAHATGRLVKIGRTSAVIDVEITAQPSGKLASKASVTYALPKA